MSQRHYVLMPAHFNVLKRRVSIDSCGDALLSSLSNNEVNSGVTHKLHRLMVSNSYT